MVVAEWIAITLGLLSILFSGYVDIMRLIHRKKERKGEPNQYSKYEKLNSYAIRFLLMMAIVLVFVFIYGLIRS